MLTGLRRIPRAQEFGAMRQEVDMKKFIGIALIALVVAAVVSAPAGATTLPKGADLVAGLNDRSSLFDSDGNPIDFGLNPVVGDENRSISVIRSIEFGEAGTDLFGVPIVSGSGSFATYQAGDLTAMLYDTVIDQSSTIGNLLDAKELYFTPGGRYADSTSGGGTDGTWTDTLVGQVTATTAGGYGGLLVVYDDPNHDAVLNSAHGPTNWSEGTGGATADGSLSASDSFTDFSDVEPFLVAVLAPLPAAYGKPAGTVLWESLPAAFSSSGDGTGIAFANIIGGTAASSFLQDFFGPGLDIRIEFEPQSLGQAVNGWQVQSDDPIQFATVPEPTTLSLLGMSLFGLFGAWKKRK
jgi:hypothetical protein